jgi:ubiquinone/menaquinone biosynthesis C-methylase UbiE
MDIISLLSVSLLKEHQESVNNFKKISQNLQIGLGWHYLLDLSWAAFQLEPAKGMRVMDAGAGTGVMQWWIAAHGADVISADRQSRCNFPIKFRRMYRVQGIRKVDLAPETRIFDLLPSLSPNRWHIYPGKLIESIRQLRYNPEIDPDYGTVFVYNQDLKSMTDISDESLDAIVSISALEHNPPDELKKIVDELMRVLKPGGKLIATMAAAKEKDWFHEPSNGWCYSESTLRELFNLQSDCPSNFDRYDELFESLRNCGDLRDNLADFYFQSENNGMPWGIWDPKYYPVGIVKIRR